MYIGVSIVLDANGVGVDFQVSGYLHNTGQFLVFRADKDLKVRVNITGGPLAYHYQFEEIYIHYGQDDNHGSEHRVNNYAFPAEVSSRINKKYLTRHQQFTIYATPCASASS